MNSFHVTILDEKFPRSSQQLRRQLPDSHVSRLHEFASDLAIGYEEGAWESTVTVIGDRGQRINVRLIDKSDLGLALKHNLTDQKWRKELPDFEALCSIGYLAPIGDNVYTLTEKALRLAEEPATVLNVFISYRRDKSSELALLFDARIRYETNATPFVDHNLKPGDEWHAKLEEKIADCNAFICLIAPGTLCSPFVQKEIDWALKNHEEKNRLIIPVWHKKYVSKPNSKCDKISDSFNAVEVTQESAKQYNAAVDEALNRLGYSTAFLERRRSGVE